MFKWIKSAKRRLTRRTPAHKRSRFTRLMLESLEDRITPATLAPPTILDPPTAVRVDQGSYVIRGSLQAAATVVTNVSAYRDSNLNGVYDAGRDSLAGAAIGVRRGSTFSLS